MHVEGGLLQRELRIQLSTFLIPPRVHRASGYRLYRLLPFLLFAT